MSEQVSEQASEQVNGQVRAFLLEFVEDADDDGERVGRIVIGDFEEGFLASTEFWEADDYRRQWLEAAERFVEGADRTCFVTQAEEGFLEWWKVYRRDAKAVFRNQHVHFGEIKGGFEYERLYDLIPDCTLLSEDGMPVSEWVLDAAALERFVRMHGG